MITTTEGVTIQDKVFFTDNPVVFAFNSNTGGNRHLSLHLFMQKIRSVPVTTATVIINLTSIGVSVNGHYEYRFDLTDLFIGFHGYLGSVIDAYVTADNGDYSGWLLFDSSCTFIGGGLAKRFHLTTYNPYIDNSKAILTTRLLTIGNDGYIHVKYYMSETSFFYFLRTNNNLIMWNGVSSIRSIDTYVGPLKFFDNVFFDIPGHYFVQEDLGASGYLTKLIIDVVPDPDTEQSLLFRFYNSYGVNDVVLTWGEAKYIPEFAEADYVTSIDENGVAHNNPSRSTYREKLIVQSGFQTADRWLLFRDLLTADVAELYIGEEWRKCKVTCDGYEAEVIQRRPFNLTLIVDFLDDETNAACIYSEMF